MGALGVVLDPLEDVDLPGKKMGAGSLRNPIQLQLQSRNCASLPASPARAASLPAHQSMAACSAFSTSGDAMAQDKKVKRGQLTFILARGIGESFIARGVEAGDVRHYLEGALTRTA